ncbi:MAG: hypothetical protein AABY13_02035 [Nanoarchaeota archaeon]
MTVYNGTLDARADAFLSAAWHLGRIYKRHPQVRYTLAQDLVDAFGLRGQGLMPFRGDDYHVTTLSILDAAASRSTLYDVLAHELRMSACMTDEERNDADHEQGLETSLYNAWQRFDNDINAVAAKDAAHTATGIPFEQLPGFLQQLVISGKAMIIGVTDVKKKK